MVISTEERLIKKLIDLNEQAQKGDSYGIKCNPKNNTIEIINYHIERPSEVFEVFCKRNEINRNLLIPKLLQNHISYLGV